MSLCKELGDHSNVCICIDCDVCEGTDDYDVAVRYSVRTFTDAMGKGRLLNLCPHDTLFMAQHAMDENVRLPQVESVEEVGGTLQSRLYETN